MLAQAKEAVSGRLRVCAWKSRTKRGASRSARFDGTTGQWYIL